MLIGVTGTTKGLMKAQVRSLTEEYRLESFSLIHGGAPGADEIADSIAGLYDLVNVDIYPCDARRYDHWMKKRASSVITRIHDVRLPLVRNRIIARDCDRLIALPRETHEILRSGTWSTVRYARGHTKPITIIYPDGSVKRENVT